MSEELKALTDTEISKICLSLITGGKGCWHEPELAYLAVYEPLSTYRCKVASCKYYGSENGVFRRRLTNPDYLNNKSDAYDLIHFVVNEWEGEKWDKFLLWYLTRWGKITPQCIPSSYRGLKKLLSNTRALPEALASWKEG
jgi:hypothetical protein